MSLGRAGAPNPGLPPAVKGAFLVGLAVVVGIIGLQVLDDSGTVRGDVTVVTVTTVPVTPSNTVAGATTTSPSATTRAAATTTRAPAATTTTIKLRKASDIKVVIFNASGLQGAAGNMRDKLKSMGYNVTGTANLKPERTGTTVQCKSGFENEANQLGKDIGNGATVQPYPQNPPTGSSEADCLVIIGKS